MIGVEVTLNESFEIETMELTVAKQEVEAIIVGRVDNQTETAEIAALREKLSAYYQMDADRISIIY